MVGPIIAIPATNGTTSISNLLVRNAGTPAGSNWVQSGAPGTNWYFIASSTNGSLMAAAVRGGGIWLSTDRGSTWSQSSAPSNRWSSVALSADGAHLAAVVNGGGIWTSSNSGGTWVQTSAPATSWWTIASSADGTHLAAVISGGGIWTSGDGGVTWTQTSAPAGGWLTIASSALGNQLVAALSGGGGIWISTNSGSTWSQTSAPSSNWYCVSSSADGTHLAAVINASGGIWTSTNSGATWSATSAPAASWFYIASSSDGSRLAAVVYGGGIWISTDGGVTWSQSGAPGKLWVSSVWASGDGTQLAALEDGGGIWTSTGTIPLLAPATTYHFQLVGVSSGGTTLGGDVTFTTSPQAPTVTTLTATSVTATNATLNGTVNPNGAATTAYFEYGLTTNYGNFSASKILVATNGNFSIANFVSGLIPGTIYHYQLVGSNSAGTILGGDLTFTTAASLPIVTTLAATGVTAGNANLNGTVNPNGAPTTAYFEYGLTTNYGSTGQVVPLPATNGNISLSGLLINSTGSAPGSNWVKSSAPGANWYFIASSTNGSLMAAVVRGGGIWTSTNRGETWIETSAPSNSWSSVALSGDGNRLAAVVNGGGIWTSTNGGTTWSQTSAPGTNWWTIASSTDGSHLAAVVNGGGIWTSTNAGGTWSKTTAPVGSWLTIASSSLGNQLVAALSGGGGIWISSDSGATWTQSGAPSKVWVSSVWASTDGNHLAAVENGGGIWISDGTITPLAPATTYHYQLVGVNNVGTSLGGDLTFTTLDNIPPVIAPHDNLTVEATSVAGAVVTYTNAVATDNVGVTSLYYSTNSGSLFPAGVTTVYIYASDAAGNMATNSFTVTVYPLLTINLGSEVDATCTNLGSFVAIFSGGTGAPYNLQLDSGAALTNVTSPYAFHVAAGSHTVKVTDSFGGSAISSTILVGQPVVVAGTNTLGTRQNQPVAVPVAKVVIHDFSPCGLPLNITNVASPTAAGGIASLSGGLIHYSPPNNYVGQDVVTYSLTDGNSSAMGMITVTVTSTNMPGNNLVQITTSPTGTTILFAGVPGKQYFIQNSSGPNGPWSNLSGPITAAANGLIQYTDATQPAPTSRFYRTQIYAAGP